MKKKLFVSFIQVKPLKFRKFSLMLKHPPGVFINIFLYYRDGEERVTESSVIVKYLEDKYQTTKEYI